MLVLLNTLEQLLLLDLTCNLAISFLLLHDLSLTYYLLLALFHFLV